jgi:DNA repair exonuclease SbcCD ATPase subunit
LEIDDFVINEDEFRIPYIKKGVRVHDAIRCSQGERTFISLAISFALIVQSLRDYNIMLLDEIDSTLDTSYRTTFIGILETLLDVINCEQTFLITHNNMFDNYPVDIIMTSDVSIDNYRNVNILFKAS